MIRVACPHCQRTFRTMTEGMGQTAVCSGCHESFRIGSADVRALHHRHPLVLARQRRKAAACLISAAIIDIKNGKLMRQGINSLTQLLMEGSYPFFFVIDWNDNIHPHTD